MTKLQVPLLAILIWVLLAVVWPKTFDPWFDGTVADIRLVGDRFAAINSEGDELWLSGAYDADLMTFITDGDYYTPPRYYVASNGGDKSGDVYIMPALGNGSLFSYLQRWRDGKLLWTRDAYAPTDYQGDSAGARYASEGITALRYPDSALYLLVAAEASYPARMQLLLYDTSGAIVTGPYLHTGTLFQHNTAFDDVDGDGRMELVLSGINNRLNSACLVAFDPMNLSGVSPPYDHEFFSQSGMPKGTHKYYVVFAETPASSGEDIRNSARSFRYEPDSDRWVVTVHEGVGLEERLTPRLRIHYVLDSNFLPVSVLFPDGSFAAIERACAAYNIPFDMDESALARWLLDRARVYHGNTLVNYPATGLQTGAASPRVFRLDSL